MREFEDARTLRENLKEIRGEIGRVVANAEREGCEPPAYDVILPLLIGAVGPVTGHVVRNWTV